MTIQEIERMERLLKWEWLSSEIPKEWDTIHCKWYIYIFKDDKFVLYDKNIHK